MKTKYYVTMTDKFMSGWGMAENKINKLIIECDNYQQARCIYDHAIERKEMKYVNIRTSRPYFNKNIYPSFKNFRDMSGCWLKYAKNYNINID